MTLTMVLVTPEEPALVTCVVKVHWILVRRDPKIRMVQLVQHRPDLCS